MPLYYGRDPSEWEQLEDAGLAFLIERARPERVTSYTAHVSAVHAWYGRPPRN